MIIMVLMILCGGLVDFGFASAVVHFPIKETPLYQNGKLNQ